jgi:hypothetical protein
MWWTCILADFARSLRWWSVIKIFRAMDQISPALAEWCSVKTGLRRALEAALQKTRAARGARPGLYS